MYSVRTYYEAQVFYDLAQDSKLDYSFFEEKVEEHALMKLDQEFSVEVVTTSGGAAHSPYVTITGESKDQVDKAAKALVRYIRRFKGHKFY